MPSERAVTAVRLPAVTRGRWSTYQRERFPLAQHAPLIAAFSGGAVLFSAQLRAPGTLPRAAALAASARRLKSCLGCFPQPLEGSAKF